MKGSRFSVFAVMFIILTVALFVFSGSDHTVGIQQRLLCHAMGIDQQNGRFYVTVQAFKPTSAGSDTPVDITKSNIEVLSGEGRTVSEALQQCESKSGKNVFLGHLQLICFGKSVDFSDPKSLFEFCLKDRTVFLGVKICLSDTSAKELMQLQMTTGTLSTENYTAVIEKNSEKSRTVECTLLDFLKNGSEHQCTAIPVIAVKAGDNSREESDQQGESGEEPQLELVRTSLICRGKAIDTALDPNDSVGALMLRSECKEADMVLDLEQGQVSVRIVRKSRDQSICEQNGRLVYKPELTVVVNHLKDIVNSYKPEQVAQQITRKLKQQFDQSFAAAVKKCQADFFGVWKQVRLRFPKTYLRYNEDMQTLFSITDAELEVKCLVE